MLIHAALFNLLSNQSQPQKPHSRASIGVFQLRPRSVESSSVPTDSVCRTVLVGLDTHAAIMSPLSYVHVLYGIPREEFVLSRRVWRQSLGTTAPPPALRRRNYLPIR